jgi:hypothetical protein
MYRATFTKRYRCCTASPFSRHCLMQLMSTRHKHFVLSDDCQGEGQQAGMWQSKDFPGRTCCVPLLFMSDVKSPCFPGCCFQDAVSLRLTVDLCSIRESTVAKSRMIEEYATATTANEVVTIKQVSATSHSCFLTASLVHA